MSDLPFTLESGEAAFRLPVESVKDYAIFLLDAHGRVATWNAGAKQIAGYSAEEIIGWHFSCFYPDEYLAVGKPEKALEVARNEGRIEDEGWRIRKDGTRFWAGETISAIRDEAGELRGYSQVTRDLTERRAVQEKLRRSEEQLRLLIESVRGYAICMLDRTGHVMTWNAGAERIEQYRPDEIVGRHFEIFYSATDRAKGLPRQLLTQAQAHGHVRVEGIGVRKDGSQFRAESLISPVRDENGNLRGFSEIIRDITEQIQQREAAERARIAAETANKAKDRFLAILSHELRTPLTPVLAVVGYLTKQTSTLSRELRSEMEMIRRNVELEARLIDDLLDITKVASGKLELALEVTDAHEAVRHAFDICAEEIKTKKIEVELDLEASAHHVLADPVRLHQVFWNLISNAVKFTPAQGRIRIRSQNERDGEFLFEIEDDGIGIEAETLSHIFEPFEQGGNLMTRQFGGLGLGLAITKTLVDLHQGRLEALSQGRNAGAKFKLALKSVAQENTGGVAADEDGGSKSALRILVVDDHEDTKRAFSRLLRAKGHEVFAAGDIASALKTLRDESIDVLLSDLGLPDGTGYDLMTRARTLQPLAGIALSGFGTAEDVAQAINAGFAHHLIKPVNFEQLERLLRGVTSKRIFENIAPPILEEKAS